LKTIQVLQKLDRETSAEVYLVGGFVRDFLRGEQNHDLDTVVKGLSIKRIQGFLKKHGKAKMISLAKIKDSFNLNILLFQAYNDETIAQLRLPARGKTQIQDPSNSLRQDASHRDFKINALYMPINAKTRNEIIDVVDGKVDLTNRRISAVGKAEDRIREHPTRIMRAISLAARTGFHIDEDVLFAIATAVKERYLGRINADNIRTELNHILLSGKPSKYFKLMHLLGVLKVILPELEACINVRQEGRYHKWDVFHHCIYTCDNTEPDLILRLAGLLHDIGKPATKGKNTTGKITFHKHEMASVKLGKILLRRLNYDNATIKKVLDLVRLHMYHYTRDHTDGAIRRFISKANVTAVDIDDLDKFPLFKLRAAERLGNGFKKIAVTTKQKDFEKRIIAVFKETSALRITDLDINGHDIMRVFKLKPSPLIKQIQDYLLKKVMDNQNLNRKVELIKLVAAYLLKIDNGKK
jgi:tRNA nucleotidyltransferase (CCA-adding enzyme)